MMEYDDEDWDDDDYGDDWDDDEVDTIDCPECGREVYEEADTCPECGCYIHHGYRAGGHYPWWTFGGALEDWSPFWIFLAMLGVIVLMVTLMFY